MPSAKQIKAREAFVRKYAKKGKRKAKSKKPKKPTKEKHFYKALSQEDSQLLESFDEQWDRKMKAFLNKSNNES